MEETKESALVLDNFAKARSQFLSCLDQPGKENLPVKKHNYNSTAVNILNRESFQSVSGISTHSLKNQGSSYGSKP